MLGADGEADTEEDGLALDDGDRDRLGVPETLALGLTELLGLSEREADAEGLTLELGLTEDEGEREREDDSEALAEGDTLDDGLNDVLADGLSEREADELALDDGLTDEDGEADELGERDTIKDCILIIQLVLVNPTTFLNVPISPKTLPAGWGP